MAYVCAGPEGLIWQRTPVPEPVKSAEIQVWEFGGASAFTPDIGGDWCLAYHDDVVLSAGENLPWAWLAHPDDEPPGHKAHRDTGGDRKADTFVALAHLGVEAVTVPVGWEPPANPCGVVVLAKNADAARIVRCAGARAAFWETLQRNLGDDEPGRRTRLEGMCGGARYTVADARRGTTEGQLHRTHIDRLTELFGPSVRIEYAERAAEYGAPVAFVMRAGE